MRDGPVGIADRAVVSAARCQDGRFIWQLVGALDTNDGLCATGASVIPVFSGLYRYFSLAFSPTRHEQRLQQLVVGAAHLDLPAAASQVFLRVLRHPVAA